MRCTEGGFCHCEEAPRGADEAISVQPENQLKNQYFGDVNDYRKYGLLRVLATATRFPIGICWLLTAPDGRSDGEFRRYLEAPDRWRAHDPELYDRLRRLLTPGTVRSVQHARTWELVPGARYYEEILGDGLRDRQRYFEGAWSALRACPVVFLDPDNGLEVPSKPRGAKDSSKYVFWQEVSQFYARGHSLVIYQHFIREQRDTFTARIAGQLADRLQTPLVQSFRTAHVVFFLVARPEHVAAFGRVHEEVQRRWSGQIRAEEHLKA